VAPVEILAEVDIEAPASRVWEILTDLPAYAEWNPFTPRVESTLRLGDPVHLYVRLRGEKLSHRVETLTANEAPAGASPGRLCWGMKMGAPFVLAAERCQTVAPLGDGRCHFVNRDVFTGLLAPIAGAGFGKAVQRGFEEVASTLKKRAEA